MTPKKRLPSCTFSLPSFQKTVATTRAMIRTWVVRMMLKILLRTSSTTWRQKLARSSSPCF